MWMPNLVLASIAADISQYLIGLLTNPSTWIATVLTIIGLIWAKGLRGEHLAWAFYYGYHWAEEFANTERKFGRPVPSGVEKFRLAMKKADEYCRNNKWRPLKPNEENAGAIQLNAINAAYKLAEKIGGAPTPSPR